jgi:hypothetical protein
MKTRKMLAILVLALGLMVFMATSAQAEPMGSAFTYQGRLMDGNSPADGFYDLQFKLYDSPSDGNQLASIIDINELDVLDGYLTVLLDFGSDVFIGNACWLEMGVRPGELNDPNAYTTLIPRQQITPTPYALGYLNPLLGLETAFSSATGNTFYGYGAGASNTTGNYNTFLGYYAGNKNTTGSWNIFSGTYAGYKNTTASYNTFSGYGAGYSNTTGGYNTFSGYRAGYSNTASGYNTFSGYGAGCYNTTGNSNTFSGYAAGYLNTTGRRNAFSGACAGYSNTTGNGNVFIGYQAGYYETGSNKLYIANGQPDPNVLIYGDFSTGNVGIGTTDLSHRLTVKRTDSDDVLRLIGTGSWGSGARLSWGDPDYVYIEEDEDDNLYIYGSDRTAIMGGYVGIGMTNPAYELDVSGDIYASGNYYGGIPDGTIQYADMADPFDIGSDIWDWNFDSGYLNIVKTSGYPVVRIENQNSGYCDALTVYSTSATADSGSWCFRADTYKGYAGYFNKYTDDGMYAVHINSPSNTSAGLYVKGTFTATGTKAAVITTSQGQEEIFCIEGPEVEIYCSGSASLSGGSVAVAFDRLFTEAVSSQVEIRVTVTPIGGWSGLYLESTGPAGFTVRSGAGDQNVKFHWMACGRRKGYETRPINAIPNTAEEQTIREAKDHEAEEGRIAEQKIHENKKLEIAQAKNRVRPQRKAK